MSKTANYQPRRRQNDSLSRKAFTLVKYFFTMLGVGVFISFLSVGYIVNKHTQATTLPPLADHTVLTFTFEGEVPETLSTKNPKHILKPQARLHDITHALKQAATEDHVKGFIAKIKPNTINFAQIQELRDAIEMFKNSGKFTAVFSTGFGEFGTGMKDYYLASIFDQIWLQPIGTVSITGISGQLPFFKETLDKIGIHADLHAREGYKTAVEPLTRSDASQENSEMTNRLLQTIYQQMVTDIAQDRDLSKEALTQLINQAPLFDAQALEAKLITHIGYLDQMVKDAKIQSLNKDAAKLMNLTRYNRYLDAQVPTPSLAQTLTKLSADEEDATETAEIVEPLSPSDKQTSDTKPETAEQNTSEPKPQYGPNIALIYASGTIVPDDTQSKSLAVSYGANAISAEDTVIAIGDARKAKNIGAIVLRIDSPGGSPTASETIARAITRARTAGKPVVISMGGSAASGGYWIATHADKIIAQPSTLTGSIGVLAGKFVTKGLHDKIGLNVEDFSFGENANMWSTTEKFSGNGLKRVNAHLDHIYNAFLQRVSEGRHIPIEKLRSDIAGGRVWTGSEAKDLGLVDELGGLDTAIAQAKTLMDLSEGQTAQVIQYPPEKNKFELLVDLVVNGALFENPLQTYMHTQLQSLGVNSIPPQGLSTFAPLPQFE